MKKSIYLLCVLFSTVWVGCTHPGPLHLATTENAVWQVMKDTMLENPFASDVVALTIDVSSRRQVVEGFGACFNELGWESLKLLPKDSLDKVMSELFEPSKGANFSICRMPIGANDFSRDWYSYNETEADFDMDHFSISNDMETLIPFIKKAQAYNPDIRIWASPWCPPSWMKHNKHYASAYREKWADESYQNGLTPNRVGKEGTDMFICDSLHLKAYALYFQKFIQAYRHQGIDVFAVMPQNEFNSAQVFPSCCWTARGLTNFIGHYLGPVMKQEKVDVMFGTVERGNELLVDTVLKDPYASKYVSGVGFQWAGRKAIKAIRQMYPDMKLYQTEQECGNGMNNWAGVIHSWDLLKHFFDNGVSVYDYWNISLLKGGISRWGWAQNSLVVIEPEEKTYQFTNEYYLMKHLSHFVLPGACYLETTGEATDQSLTFCNLDGSIVVLFVEKEGRERWLQLNLSDEKKMSFFIQANSINTIRVPSF